MNLSYTNLNCKSFMKDKHLERARVKTWQNRDKFLNYLAK